MTEFSSASSMHFARLTHGYLWQPAGTYRVIDGLQYDSFYGLQTPPTSTAYGGVWPIVDGYIYRDRTPGASVNVLGNTTSVGIYTSAYAFLATVYTGVGAPKPHCCSVQYGTKQWVVIADRAGELQYPWYCDSTGTRFQYPLAPGVLGPFLALGAQTAGNLRTSERRYPGYRWIYTLRSSVTGLETFFLEGLSTSAVYEGSYVDGFAQEVIIPDLAAYAGSYDRVSLWRTGGTRTDWVRVYDGVLPSGATYTFNDSFGDADLGLTILNPRRKNLLTINNDRARNGLPALLAIDVCNFDGRLVIATQGALLYSERFFPFHFWDGFPERPYEGFTLPVDPDGSDTNMAISALRTGVVVGRSRSVHFLSGISMATVVRSRVGDAGLAGVNALDGDGTIVAWLSADDRVFVFDGSEIEEIGAGIRMFLQDATGKGDSVVQVIRGRVTIRIPSATVTRFIAARGPDGWSWTQTTDPVWTAQTLSDVQNVASPIVSSKGASLEWTGAPGSGPVTLDTGWHVMGEPEDTWQTDSLSIVGSTTATLTVTVDTVTIRGETNVTTTQTRTVPAFTGTATIPLKPKQGSYVRIQITGSGTITVRNMRLDKTAVRQGPRR